MIALLLLLGCPDPSPTPTPLEDVLPAEGACDAGDEAWVRRTLPLVWGRRPHGEAEVQAWTRLIPQIGRHKIVEVLSISDEYHDSWMPWFLDTLGVARVGDREHHRCYAKTRRPAVDGALGRFLAEHDPAGSDFGEPFDMADVLRESLFVDDLSLLYRAHLLARMDRPVLGANVSLEELEHVRRVSFGESFYEGLLDRDLTCLPCHNSERSVTGSEDPALDRTWEVPGHFEAALLGASGGRDPAEAYAVFRHHEVVDGERRIRPWGMDRTCGHLVPPERVPDRDLLGERAFFLGDLGTAGSVWDVEAALAEGVDQLARDGLRVGPDGAVGGEAALAWLVGMHLADRVWERAVGSPLTVAFGFPRNRSQRDRLARLTARFTGARSSLRELLVAVTEDPYFNPGTPGRCGGGPYDLAPVFDPWTPSDDDRARRGNGAGERVQRLDARALIRSTEDALDWPAEKDFPPGPERYRLEAALGAWLRESQPGSDGVDLQGMLAFEDWIAGCDRHPSRVDRIDRIVAAAEGRPVREAVQVLQDRLLSRTTLDPEDEPWIEVLVGLPLDEPAPPGPLEDGLRALCGTLAVSPLALLITETPPQPPLPWSEDPGADCAVVEALAERAGVQVDCE